MKLNELLQVVKDDNIIEIIDNTSENGVNFCTRTLTRKKDLHYLLSLDKIVNKKVIEIMTIDDVLFVNIGDLKIEVCKETIEKMEKKKITKAEVEKVMDSPEAKMFIKTLNEFLEQSKEQIKEKLKMKREIKLRDMTKEQWDSYKRNVCMWLCIDCPIKAGKCFVSTNEYSWFNNKDMYSNKFLDQKVEIEIPDILDEAEKRYLRAVIRPFRNKIIYIKKVKCANNNYFISIKISSEISSSRDEKILFPWFQNEMYVGMKDDKEYTLEELDL